MSSSSSSSSSSSGSAAETPAGPSGFVQSAYAWRNVWVPLSGFVLLSPGFILTIPPNGEGLFFSGRTNFWAVLFHAVLFFVWIAAWNMFLCSKVATGPNGEVNKKCGGFGGLRDPVPWEDLKQA